MRNGLSLANPLLILVVLVAGLATGARPSTAEMQGESSVELATAVAARAQMTEVLRSSSVMFIENAGQWNDGARFQVRGAGERTVWLAEDAIWLTILEPAERDDASLLFHPERFDLPAVGEPRRGANIKLSFVGANPHPVLKPFNLLDTVVSYFLGNDPAGWQPDVPVWGGVRYIDIYPGIDLELTSEGGQLVQRLAARAGADLRAVRLRVEGAESVALHSEALRLSTAAGEAVWPLLRMEGSSGKAAVEPHSALAFDVTTPVTNARPNEQLVIAPVQSPDDTAADLLYGTFLGGSNDDGGNRVAVDASGAAYITGYATSSNFPTTPGASDTTYSGGDAFVVKLNATGTALVYATLVGGSNQDGAYDIAVDPTGAAYVTGWTYSDDFPGMPGAFDSSYGGYRDAFVVKLNAYGTGLAYGTYLGGSGDEFGRGISVDSSGAAYVTGATESSDFPTTAGVFDATFNGYFDVFVAKLNAAGSDLAYSTYLGGIRDDTGGALAVDATGSAYVTGGTRSSDFPSTPTAFDLSYNGGIGGDAFVVKLDSAGADLVYGTFLGGVSGESGSGIAVDSSGAAYIGGHTASYDDFPVTPGAFDTTANGNDDAYAAKLDAAGTTLVYATYLGGSGPDHSTDIAVDSNGSAYVTGNTASPDFPATSGAFDASHNGNYDTFAVRLNAAGADLAYATFLGGSSRDDGVGIAVHSSEAAYVTGVTYSSDFPVTLGAFDTSYNGGQNDAFVVKLAMGGEAVPLSLKLLFVPLRWQGTQAEFDAEVDTQVDFFLSDVPLGGCRNQVLVEKLDVETQNFDEFTCSASDCAVGSVEAFVRDELDIDPENYDIVVGLAESSPCSPIAGCSNEIDTIWVTSAYDIVTAHEIGHIYGLEDEYCSNQAGSTDDRCNDGDSQGDGAATGDVNWLDASLPCDCPADGSSDSGGTACCNFGGYDCSVVNYGVCCQGNKNAAGGRSTMSYANAPAPRGFDDHDLAHLGSIPELTCDVLADTRGLTLDDLMRDTSATILDVNLRVHSDDSVGEESITITDGRPTADSVLQNLNGDYSIAITDAEGGTLWSQAFGLYFDYSGPVVLGVDYSGISYDAVDVSFRIPYVSGMTTLELYHGQDLIYSRTLPRLSRVYLPLVLRNH